MRARTVTSGHASPKGLLLLTLFAGCTSNPPVQGTSSSALPPGVSFRERLDTYRFSGADRDAIRQGIDSAPARNGQERFAGYYQWNLAWGVQVQREGPTCRVALATVAIDAIVTLPSWRTPPDADAALVREWKRYLTALATHEVGHRDIIQQGAISIQRAILDLPPQQCDAMQSAVQQVAQPLLLQIKQDSVRYDETTRHGVTQGAVWPG